MGTSIIRSDFSPRLWETLLQYRRLGHRVIGALMLLTAEFGCGDVNLQTTFLADQNTNNSNSNTGVLSPTFFVQGRSLYDPCGKPVVLRGINEMITFIPAPGNTGSSVFPQIAQTQANSVRLYWQMTDTADEIDVALTNAEQWKLIPIIYVFSHDPNNPNNPHVTTTVSMAADYWTSTTTSPTMVSVMQKHEHWLIIALREKNLTTAESPSDWATNYQTAVARIRNAGINVPLAIDAPTEGSDIDTLQSMGLAMIAADPNHNLLLNVNAWSSYFTADAIRSDLTAAQQAALPLIVGEFSGYEQPGCSNTPFDYSTLLAVAQETGTGFLAWSWGGATNFDCPVGYLDMTPDGTYAGLISKAGWGYNVAVADPNSIQIQNNKAGPSAYSPGSVCPSTN